MNSFNRIFQTTTRLASLVLVAGLMSACTMGDRLAEIGRAPDPSPISNPVMAPGYQPVMMPMPPENKEYAGHNSLWKTGNRAFFKDQRASNVGDILTVVINIEDEAELSNTTDRSRVNSESANLPSFFGYESALGQVLPEAINPADLLDFDSNTNTNGSGSVIRSEDIEMRVAAIITQTLPNGNLVIQGRQEIRVNYERRDLVVQGIIRPEDIATNNTIQYDQIAEARVVYGGKGQITDLQQPRYGQQLFDVVFPF